MERDITSWINWLTALVFFVSFLMLVRRDLRVLLRLYTLQAVLAGLIAVAVALQLDIEHLWITAVSTLIAKAVLIPWGLRTLLSRVQHTQKIPLALNPSWLAILGGGVVGLSYILMNPIAAALPSVAEWQLTSAMAMIFLGLCMVIAHRSAIGQIIGFLTMENGVLLLSVATTLGWPAFVELGLLLDILLGILLFSTIVARMDTFLKSIDTNELSELTDD